MSKKIVTDSNGLATINDISEGTTVIVTEVTAPNGYFKKGEIKKVVIKPNTTVSVTLTIKNSLYSTVQRADDIVVVLPVEAGEKHFESEDKIRLINPKITAEGYKIGNRGFTNYIMHADDMVKA
ncbi:MAG: DUF961 family protein [Breznakia sp.]